MISVEKLNLFPIIFEYRKYGLTFRRLGHCCNHDFYTLKRWLLIQFIFKDVVYWRCPYCGKIHGLKLSWHTETYFDKDIRDINKKLEDFRYG